MKLASPLLTALASLLLLPLAQAAEAPAAAAKDEGNPRVELNTSEGAIVIELDRKNAPVSTANFLAYVDAGHYDGTIFHRVIKGFVVQGGGYDIALKEKATKAPIKLEAGLPNVRGSLAMARTNDPNSATSQFYINLVDNKMLDPRSGSPGYAVFGKVVEGMDVVDRIAGHPTRSTYELGPDVPKEAVTISKAKRLSAQP